MGNHTIIQKENDFFSKHVNFLSVSATRKRIQVGGKVDDMHMQKIAIHHVQDRRAAHQQLAL